MRFAKGHGTGNDFVIVPDLDDALELSAADVTRLCDRRFGIGGDGMLRVVRTGGEWFMDYRNADGSLAETCGNGIRVYARYLVEAGLARLGPVPLRTRAGSVVAVVDADTVAVDMGQPRVYAHSTATVSGRRLPGTAVDCGNPHLVCPAPALSELDLSVPPVVDSRLFPAGVNVEFTGPGEPVSGGSVPGGPALSDSAPVRPVPGRPVPSGSAPGVDLHMRVRVHERGSGETLSCGSGAVAVAVVALRDAGRSRGVVAVDLPGGRLVVTVDDATAWLAGPAVIVAWGETALLDGAPSDRASLDGGPPDGASRPAGATAPLSAVRAGPSRVGR